MITDCDVLILGSGAAGLAAALSLPHKNVVVATKATLWESASNRAQGGIASPIGESDSIELHVADTLSCGAGLCAEAAVRQIITHAPEAIAWLKMQGVPFTSNLPETVGLHLTKEGGHSRSRIVHADDFTGHAVIATLLQKAKEAPHITFLENHLALGILSEQRAAGVHFLRLDHQDTVTISAKAIVLATGGAGQLFRYTTNPPGSTGDGIALAWRAGCRIANLEFYQFHPTAFIQEDRVFLISEAVRGEGGRLITEDGKRFMAHYDPRAELAPRDIVARGIAAALRQGNTVYLDITQKSRSWLTKRFPTIFSHLQQYGLDMSKDLIPVVPAAHYCCGGVATDPYGRTDIPGLYAIGEVACTGLHGANRLASNSLLECIVMGRSVAAIIGDEQPQAYCRPEHSIKPFAVPTSFLTANKIALQNLMWDHAGIIRNEKNLLQAQEKLAALYQESLPSTAGALCRDKIELANLFLLAGLLLQSAIFRRESRGAHMNTDYPFTFPCPLPTVLAPWA
jgi:L-aspartate oxidase